MSTQTIRGYIVWEKWKGESNESAIFKFSPYEPTGNSEIWDQVLVGAHSFEVEIPDNFNPVPAQVAMLEEQKRLARLELSRKLAALDEQLSKLQCLTNDVLEAA